MKLRHLFLFCVICCSVSISAQNKSKLPKTSGNPIFPGWYADPEGIVFGDEYWIYPTYSAAYDDQIFMDAFSSKDLVNWTKHPKVLSKENISWLRRALWAPAVIHANDKYYFFFGANDIQNNNELGGIGVAVADNPAGPFKDALGKPLIDKIVNGAQPIDQFVFKDDDGQYYMYYGGWGHCNMVKMAPDLLSIVPFEDGTIYKEVTPQNYVEGPFMLKHNGKYYFMCHRPAYPSSRLRKLDKYLDTPRREKRKHTKSQQRKVPPLLGRLPQHHAAPQREHRQGAAYLEKAERKRTATRHRPYRRILLSSDKHEIHVTCLQLFIQ